ncbi:MAG: oxidoreductase [Bernardetiaceae bacterium]|jgi:uncharacterized protein YbjT (DUF2867 family)|nr:oxidoreductase [Bernardetiaceae bacterium]
MKALLLGASGLTGSLLLPLLLQHPAFTQVTVAGRRPLALQHPKLRQLILDFDHPEAQADQLAADVVFCCLGTTIAKAGSQAAFRRVDYEYPLRLAQLARAQGATKWLLVSALGAHARSSVFYSRVKGELERDLAAVGFASLVILRPSLLLGPRYERRPGEQLAQRLTPLLNPLLWGPLRKYRAIAAQTVAQAMLKLALADLPGVVVKNSDELEKMGRSADF